MTFSRIWLDAASFIAHKAFQIYGGELCIWDRGVAATDGRVMSSPDGTLGSWTALFSVDAATYGNCNVDDGNAFAIYDDNLFVAMYRSDAVSPKVLEWDGLSITSHLVNPQGGGANNYMAADLEVYARRLWCLTDVTAGVSDRRVVYYYDGSSWTAITDYDGATYLDFNSPNDPLQQTRHRVSRLFVFNDELYFVASRYSPSYWAWEVWQFDAEDMDNFTLLYDSIALLDNCALSAIIEFEEKVWVVGNELMLNGDPTDIARLYSSEDMVTWTEETDFSLFLDEFDDAARHADWTDEPNNGTITEAAGVLTLAIAGAVDGNWWQPNIENSPFVKFTPTSTRLTVVTQLNNFTVNDKVQTGLIIGNTTTIPDAAGGYCISFVRMRGDPTAVNGLRVADVGRAALATVTPLVSLPIWLRMRISGNGAGSVIDFDYSVNGTHWINIWTENNFTWSFVGLHAKNWVDWNAISAPYEYFRIYESLGFPYGEAVSDGKFYLNCQDILTSSTLIRCWNGRKGEFEIEQEIATNVDSRGGGLGNFSNALYAGKYMEVYSEPVAVRKQLRQKRQSLWLGEITFINKLGEELQENLAPIDVRAPTRFYRGRIKHLSSFTRAVDDRTGLFKIADLSMTLANNDKRYSSLITNYMLKNQIFKLYHCWADEPEAFRRHVISLVVDDHTLHGPHFEIKLKDITQRYFSRKIPQSICTADDYPNIYADHVGRYMPEVLGDVSMTTGEQRGAVEAVYVNTAGPPYQYLASRGQLNGITTVYSDNVAMNPVDWAFVAGPPSLINITPDQGDANITYDGEGYSFGIWDDPTNGYVQNPAYIVAYFLRVLMGMPPIRMDMFYFDQMADYFEDIADHQSGYLIIQDSVDNMEKFRQLLFTYGLKGFVAMDGKLRIDRKDIHNWAVTSTDSHIFDQIEFLATARREYNLQNAINTIKARYNYIPWARLFLGAESQYQDNFYGEDMEDDIRIPRENWPV